MKKKEDEFSHLVLTKGEAGALQRLIEKKPFIASGASADQFFLASVLTKLKDINPTLDYKGEPHGATN